MIQKIIKAVTTFDIGDVVYLKIDKEVILQILAIVITKNSVSYLTNDGNFYFDFELVLKEKYMNYN